MLCLGKDYARADARFGVSDPCTVAGNLGCVLLSLPLAAAIIYGICQASPWRYVHDQIVTKPVGMPVAIVIQPLEYTLISEISSSDKFRYDGKDPFR